MATWQYRIQRFDRTRGASRMSREARDRLAEQAVQS